MRGELSPPNDATVIVGCKIDGSRQTAADEIRITSVSGGERRRVAAGDVVHIPTNTPHQMLVDTGHQVTYFVVKVESRYVCEPHGHVGCQNS
jgi:hypothetical protein